MPYSWETQPGHSGQEVVLNGDLLLMYEPGRFTAIRLWPESRAWRKDESAEWLYMNPDIDLRLRDLRRKQREAKRECKKICPDFLAGQMPLSGIEMHPAFYSLNQAQRSIATFRSAFSAIPTDVRRMISPFPDKHFSLLSFSSHCDGGNDLTESTPALALMLANSWAFKKKPVRHPQQAANDLLRKRQPAILDWLEWPHADRALVKLLRKLPKRFCSIETLLSLRNAFSITGNRKHLAHLTRINRGAIDLLSRPELLPYVSPTLLEEVARDRTEDVEPRIGPQLKELLAAIEELGCPFPKSAFKSVEQIGARYNDFWVRHHDRADELDMAKLLACELPPPPLPGTDEIVPLSCAKDLEREGQSQNHCILNYAMFIANGERGECYAYKVLGEERATVLIAKDSEISPAIWDIEEIHGKSNSEISQSTTRKVRSWLASNQEFQSEEKKMDFLLGRHKFDFPVGRHEFDADDPF